MSERIAARFRHAYPGFELDVDLDLPARGITAFYGPSGSGKTTLLRCIAGLEQPASGHFSLAGDLWQDQTHFRPCHRRPLGYVFQEASLFAHLSVAANLDYALRRADPGPPALTRSATIELLGLGSLLERLPHQLSGGERQRVAIGRALLVNPALLLMDEPLAALDAERRAEILPYLERLHAELARPMLYVSHAAEEVARLADHLVVLDAGRVSASGELQSILARLDDPLRLGDAAGVVWEGSVAARDALWGLMRLSLGASSLWLADTGLAEGAPVRVRILARDVSLTLGEATDSSILNRLPATVTAIGEAEGASTLVGLATGGHTLLARLTRRSVAELGLTPGQQVWAQIKTTALLR